MSMSIITKEHVERLLQNPIDVEVVEETSSTNSVLKERAEKRPTLLVALSQTAGRGRLERSFFSGKDCGVYFSFLIDNIPAAKSDMLTVVAAIATHRALSAYSSKDIGIKWVNDVYADGKKCAGVLVEGSLNEDTGSLNYAIVGIGINIREPLFGYPEDIRHIATTALAVSDIRDDIECSIIADVYNNFCSILTTLDRRSIVSEYRASLCMLDRQVVVCAGDAEILATALDVDANGHLILRLADGRLTTLSVGEVRLKI